MSMDLDFSKSEIAFRDDVRAFVASVFPPLRPYQATAADQRAWHDALLSRNWAGWRWPTEFGGPDWTPTQKFIWERETEAAGLPSQVGGMGMGMLAPVLFAYGSQSQKSRFLPDILAGRVHWCQGYSEPGAGSDLASLKTSAVRSGDGYIVNGEKIWTSGAHHADMMFCLTRTSSDGPRQAGITFLLLNMRDPGVAVYPLISIDGQHGFNRVTFTDVYVPADDRVGEENEGWRVAKGLLTHERTGQAYVSLSLTLLAGIRQAASDVDLGDHRLIDDPAFAARLALAEVELKALEITELRTLSTVAAGSAPGDESSILKLKGTEIVQRMTEQFVDCAGPYAAPWLPDIILEGSNSTPVGPDYAQRELIRYFSGRGASIAGGSDEVQRNIIAKHVLRL